MYEEKFTNVVRTSLSVCLSVWVFNDKCPWNLTRRLDAISYEAGDKLALINLIN